MVKTLSNVGTAPCYSKSNDTNDIWLSSYDEKCVIIQKGLSCPRCFNSVEFAEAYSPTRCIFAQCIRQIAYHMHFTCGYPVRSLPCLRPPVRLLLPLLPSVWHRAVTPYTWAEKFESFERINSIRETNGNFGSCNSCKRLGTSRLHELHEPKFPFVSRIEFIRSKLSNFSAHVYGVCVWLRAGSPASLLPAAVTRRGIRLPMTSPGQSAGAGPTWPLCGRPLTVMPPPWWRLLAPQIGDRHSHEQSRTCHHLVMIGWTTDVSVAKIWCAKLFVGRWVVGISMTGNSWAVSAEIGSLSAVSDHVTAVLNCNRASYQLYISLHLRYDTDYWQRTQNAIIRSAAKDPWLSHVDISLSMPLNRVLKLFYNWPSVKMKFNLYRVINDLINHGFERWGVELALVYGSVARD